MVEQAWILHKRCSIGEDMVKSIKAIFSKQKPYIYTALGRVFKMYFLPSINSLLMYICEVINKTFSQYSFLNFLSHMEKNVLVNK